MLLLDSGLGLDNRLNCGLLRLLGLLRLRRDLRHWSGGTLLVLQRLGVFFTISLSSSHSFCLLLPFFLLLVYVGLILFLFHGSLTILLGGAFRDFLLRLGCLLRSILLLKFSCFFLLPCKFNFLLFSDPLKCVLLFLQHVFLLMGSIMLFLFHNSNGAFLDVIELFLALLMLLRILLLLLFE